jgi:hypothetical protein
MKALQADGHRKAQKERTPKANDARRSGNRNEERNGAKLRIDYRDVDRDDNRNDARNEVQQTTKTRQNYGS